MPYPGFNVKAQCALIGTTSPIGLARVSPSKPRGVATRRSGAHVWPTRAAGSTISYQLN